MLDTLFLRHTLEGKRQMQICEEMVKHVEACRVYRNILVYSKIA